MADTPSASGTSTPNARFATSAHTAEDLLKEQTVGLVHLSDFRKRRAEALEQSRDGTPTASGATTPDVREPATKPATAFKKRKKGVKKGGLSFGDDNEEDGPEQNGKAQRSATASRDDTPAQDTSEDNATILKKRLKPSSAVQFKPKVQTKSSLAREAQLKDTLRQEYHQMQEAVRHTDFCLPFVFFNGKNAPGGVCRMRKGDFVWLFLDKARKVGAGIASTGGGARGGGMQDWARIGVDDLMLVREGLIIPHHYDFHHFILNRTTAYNNNRIFPFSAEPTAATPQDLLNPKPNNEKTSSTPESINNPDSGLTTAATRKQAATSANLSKIPDSDLEGFTSDPALTKVVDRRWYEKNKHIYPASMWEDFDPERDYSRGGRKDGMGNGMFFPR